MKPIRIGNVEYMESDNMASEPYEEIVLWYKNPNYDTEEKLKSEGWTFDKEGSAHKDSYHIHSSCFKNEYVCYTIADIEWNRAHDEFDVRSIGTRAFDLEDEDFKDFKKVLKLITETTINT